MKEIQDGQLAFVARFFQAGRFDTASAWRQFSRAHGLRRRGRIGGRRYPARPAGRPVTWGYALAFTGAFAALALGIFLFERSAWTTVPQAASAQTIILPDRTEATLAPGSTLRFRSRGFGRNGRTVRMDGKVYFAVEHDADLPFEITAAQGFVRVLGTRFQVETTADGTAVDVVDGRVLFAHAPDGRRQGRGHRKGLPVREQDGIVLTRGMHAELAAGAARPVLREPQTANPAAWASHLFRYEDTPLSAVLQELSAQFGKDLSTDQPDRRLTGEFEGTDLREILGLIEEALDLTIYIK
ncbi:MAG: FecR domain-containing protein [Bacteroidales bacterium]|jgi:transmembrane sensor|nr:FecR domain-containing protein [Bacteroidales bacterium]